VKYPATAFRVYVVELLPPDEVDEGVEAESPPQLPSASDAQHRIIDASGAAANLAQSSRSDPWLTETPSKCERELKGGRVGGSTLGMSQTSA
jgi:hypothetical protein